MQQLEHPAVTRPGQLLDGNQLYDFMREIELLMRKTIEKENYWLVIRIHLGTTFAVKFVTARSNFSRVFVLATWPAFETLVNAPFNQAAPAVTYLQFQVSNTEGC